MISIRVEHEYLDQVDQTRLKKAAQTAIEHEDAPDLARITVVITGDSQIQALNRQFLSEDHPTDVLSFPAGEADPDSGGIYLGDVIISYPQAAHQAAATGQPVQAELDLLVVHGTLHLLGYDHAGAEEKQQMWTVQEEIISYLM